MTCNCKATCNSCSWGTAEDAQLKAGSLALQEPRRECYVSAAAERWLATHLDLADTGDGNQQGMLFSIQETATPTGDAAGAAF